MGGFRRAISLGTWWVDVVARGHLSIFPDEGWGISGVGLTRQAPIAALDLVLPHRSPWSAKGGKGRVLEFFAVALLGICRV